jgi:GH35 family endo-1,4-beta-xylanase
MDADLDGLIEKNRKGDFTISFAGRQVPAGAPVIYTLTRLGFDVGGLLNPRSFGARDGYDPARYLDTLDRYFNTFTDEFYWVETEAQRGINIDEPYLSIAKWGRDHGKKMCGHTIFYGWIDQLDQLVQPWVRGLEAKELEAVMKEHLSHVLKLFEGYIFDFCLSNEAMYKHCGSGTDDYFSEILRHNTLEPVFRWAKAMAPNVNFYISEAGIVSGERTADYLEFTRKLLATGAPVGAIGIEGHLFGTRVPPTDQVWERIDALSRFHLPIRITEFGVRTRDEKVYAEDVHRFYRTCFAHPSVVGVTRWDMWEPMMWNEEVGEGGPTLPEAALWRKDWSPTPAGEVHMSLVTKEWMTKGSGPVDAQGKVKFRGFFGKYRIDVAGNSYTVEFTPEKKATEVELK